MRGEVVLYCVEPLAYKEIHLVLTTEPKTTLFSSLFIRLGLQSFITLILFTGWCQRCCRFIVGTYRFIVATSLDRSRSLSYVVVWYRYGNQSAQTDETCLTLRKHVEWSWRAALGECGGWWGFYFGRDLRVEKSDSFAWNDDQRRQKEKEEKTSAFGAHFIIAVHKFSFSALRNSVFKWKQTKKKKAVCKSVTMSIRVQWKL